MAKIKRFAIERIPIEIEYKQKVIGRMYLITNLWRFIKFAKVQPTFFGYDVCKPIYRLYVAKFQKVGGMICPRK